jgi:hypothetical protein
MTEGMAELFLKYDYVETKDLAKAFLTLVSGILVLSITFSEKIVGVSTGGRKARFALAACWVLLICALLSCGLALVLITYAAGEAIYGGEGYLTVAWRSWYLMFIAGTLLAAGLISLAAAGVLSIYEKGSVDGPTAERP